MVRAHRFRAYDSFFYEEKVASVFNLSRSKEAHLAPILERITSSDFLNFVSVTLTDGCSVELNPHLFEGSLLSDSFIQEGLHCSSDRGNFCVRVVFHGTAPTNIDAILKNGLLPEKRCGQAYGPGEYFGVFPAMSASYCKGGTKILAFAVISDDTNLRTKEIMVIDKKCRQLRE